MLAALCAWFGLQGPPAATRVEAGLVPRSAPPALSDETLRALIQQAIEPDPTAPFWGAVLVIWRGEVLYSRGYGVANLAGLPVDQHTLFDIGSVSKQFTAAAVLQLAHEHELALSDSIAAHFDAVPEPQRAITIERLLSHRSGLVQTYESDQKGPSFEDTRTGWERHLLSRPLAAAPGTEFRYCNYNYLLLALLVERVAGQPFESYVREHVFAPAGMQHTRFVGECDGDAAEQSIRRHRYRRPGPPPKACDWVWGYGYRGATGMLCSLDELRSWHRALSDDRVLGAPARATFFGSAIGGYACGWYAEQDADGRLWHTHDGRSDGYRTSVSRCGDEDALVAVLTNESLPARDVDARIRALLPRPAAAVEPTPSERER
jgi:CubicO group peptidase (beta-lactamase class C family)